MLPPTFDKPAYGCRRRAGRTFVADLRDELREFGLGLALRAVERSRELTPLAVEWVATDVNNELPRPCRRRWPRTPQSRPKRVIIA